MGLRVITPPSCSLLICLFDTPPNICHQIQICHDGICDLVESNMISVQSEYGALIRVVGKILALVSEGEEIASQGTCSRLIGVITRIQQAVDGNMIQAVFSTMEPDVQQALVAAMQ